MGCWSPSSLLEVKDRPFLLEISTIALQDSFLLPPALGLLSTIYLHTKDGKTTTSLPALHHHGTANEMMEERRRRLLLLLLNVFYECSRVNQSWCSAAASSMVSAQLALQSSCPVTTQKNEKLMPTASSEARKR